MRLTVVAVRNAKAQERPYKLFDSDGLYVLVHPNGGKYWQLKYNYLGKAKTFSLGVFPQVSLQEARQRANDARREIRDGVDPSAKRKLVRQQAKAELENNFQAVAEDWLKKRKELWTPGHSTKVLRRLTEEVFPALGRRPINQIKPQELLTVLRGIEERGVVYTAHRIQQMVGQVFRFAVASGLAERDITSDLRGALKSVKKENYARLSHNELPDFLRKLSVYEGELQTQHAIKLLMLTFVRTIELRGSRWTEFDLEKAEWRVPAERMKMRQPHIVPLSKQAVEILRRQQDLTGSFDHVFPNRNRPQTYMSENTIIYGIYRMGYHSRTTAHGFRGTASTILHEQGFNTEVIERQLAHRDRNSVRSSYNHAAYLPVRREMMQWWADFLDKEEAKQPQAMPTLAVLTP